MSSQKRNLKHIHIVQVLGFNKSKAHRSLVIKIMYTNL